MEEVGEQGGNETFPTLPSEALDKGPGWKGALRRRPSRAPLLGPGLPAPLVPTIPTSIPPLLTSDGSINGSQSLGDLPAGGVVGVGWGWRRGQRAEVPACLQHQGRGDPSQAWQRDHGMSRGAKHRETDLNRSLDLG